MHRISSTSRSIINLFDVLMLLLSPLAMLMFIVGVIALLDRGGAHYRFVNRLERSGQVTEGTIISSEKDAVLGWSLALEELDQEETQYVFLQDRYYPAEVSTGLHAGGIVTVRYLPGYESAYVVLEEYFGEVKGYLGFAIEPWGIMLAAWLWLIFCPELLYLGYYHSFDTVMSMRSTRSGDRRKPRGQRI